MYVVFDLLWICTQRINEESASATWIDEALDRAADLWKTVYEHRQVLDLGILEEHGLAIEINALEIQLVSVLLRYHSIYAKRWGLVRHSGS